MDTLALDDDSFVLVLTGAGASKDSGIPTFRDAAGLWERHPVEEVASPEGFAKDPALVWRFYSQRRDGVLKAAPNPAHHALRAFEEQLGDRFLLVTQNVDGLHLRAGSERVIELHGNLLYTRCATCEREPFEDHALYLDGAAPPCTECATKGHFGLLRPHIVWFGEQLEPAHLARIEDFMRQANSRLRFVAVGTSGVVFPAAGLVDAARRVGGRSWLVNAERADNAHCFDAFVEGRAADVLPAFLGVG